MCPQPNRPLSAMSEDCLRLNVYTKSLPFDGDRLLKPVIVYIPGGGYYVGSGLSTDYGGPKYLLERDIVLVTINYRLATLGFLALGIAEVPGNAGFKDMVFALRWVKANIPYFGGDPDSVTVLGNSAAAMAIPLLMVSPMAAGLFHRGILMSGGIGVQFQTPPEQIYLGERQAKIMNCSETGSVDGIYRCLKTADAFVMSTNLYSMFDFGHDNPIILWTAVVEADFGQERFIIEDPYEALLVGKYMQIPIMIGVTSNELATSAVDIVSHANLLREFDENFSSVAPLCFAYGHLSNRSQAISEGIWSGYNMSRPLSVESLPAIHHMFSDAMIGFGVHRFVQIVNSDDTNLFYYKFTYMGRYSYLYYPEGKPYGVEHGDDLLYLLGNAISPPFKVIDPEAVVVERMTRMWSRFATTGNPNDAEDGYISVANWTAYTEENQNYLDIGEEMVNRQRMFEERYNIWDKLFPLRSRQKN